MPKTRRKRLLRAVPSSPMAVYEREGYGPDSFGIHGPYEAGAHGSRSRILPLHTRTEITMRCEELMKRVIECVTPEETAEHAARRMRDSKIGFLPVCQDTRVLGTITDRDLAIRVVAESRSLKTSIGDIFTREVVACRPEDDLDVAQELMSQHHKSRLMCIDAAGQLVGVISLSDIAQVEVRGDTAAQTLRRIAAREVQ